MKLDKIILELKKVKTGEQELDNVISDLEKEFKESEFITKPSDKKKLSAIKKVVNKSKNSDSYYKNCIYYNSYTRQLDKSYITDSYQLYELNDEYLPLEYAKSNLHINNQEYLDKAKKEEQELIKKYNLTVKDGFYPTVYNLFDSVNSYEEKLYKFDVGEMLKLEKTTLKEDGKKIHTIKVDNLTISFDLVFLKNAIDILQLQGKATLKIYGDTKPIILENDKGERGLILPVKKY